jgi:hypothetical protein
MGAGAQPTPPSAAEKGFSRGRNLAWHEKRHNPLSCGLGDVSTGQPRPNLSRPGLPAGEAGNPWRPRPPLSQGGGDAGCRTRPQYVSKTTCG